MRPIWIVAIVAAMVVVAGCAGADSSPGGSGASDEGTAASGGGNGGSSAGDDADEYDLGDPERLLTDAGSFTASWSLVVEEAGMESTVTSVYRVDLEAGRSSEVFSVTGDEEGVSFDRFYADGTSYTRYESEGEAFYQVLPQESNVFEEAISRGVWSDGDVNAENFAGTETFDGVSVGRYEYTDRSVWRNFGTGTFEQDTEVTVTDFTVVVLVDGDGLARSTSWTLVGENEDGERLTAEWTYTVTDVGTTAVEDPDWLDEADAQSPYALDA